MLFVGTCLYAGRSFSVRFNCSSLIVMMPTNAYVLSCCSVWSPDMVGQHACCVQLGPTQRATLMTIAKLVHSRASQQRLGLLPGWTAVSFCMLSQIIFRSQLVQGLPPDLFITCYNALTYAMCIVSLVHMHTLQEL